MHITNYFDLSVKNNREDLYDRERELAELMEGIQTPVSAVIGMRRTGKSSLISVGLKGTSHIIVDLRGIGPNPSPLAILQRFERAINSTKLNSLWNSLSKVSGITIGSVGIQLSRKRGEYPDLQSVIDMMQEWAEKQGTRFVIALDEAQEARGYKILEQVIAHSYDYNKNLAFVLAGSEIGLLYDFLGQEDEKSALYGRHLHFVEVKKFSKEQSVDFLTKGFKAHGKEPLNIEDASEKLGGIPGWLVLYGYEAVNGRTDLDLLVDRAVKLVEDEVKRLTARGKHYKHIFKALSAGKMKWKETYNFVLALEGTVSESSFNDALKQLQKLSIVEKEYEYYKIADPMVRESIRRVLS